MQRREGKKENDAGKKEGQRLLKFNENPARIEREEKTKKRNGGSSLKRDQSLR